MLLRLLGISLRFVRAADRNSVSSIWFAARLYCRERMARAFPIAAMARDLLGRSAFYFKYGSFFVRECKCGAGTDFVASRLVLPLGISFFPSTTSCISRTCLRGNAPQYRFRDYALYIVLFPQILAVASAASRVDSPNSGRSWSGDAAERWGAG